MDSDAPSNGNKTTGRRHPAAEFLLWVVDTLASVRVAVWIVSIIAVCCLLGTILPQAGGVLKYIEAYPERRTLMEWLTRIGLTRMFSVWWFSALLGVLALSLSACAGRRLKSALRLTGRARGRAAASVVTHLSMVLILIGGVVRGIWGLQGSIQLHEGETRTWFQSGRDRIDLPFALRLVDFELEVHEPEPSSEQSITVSTEELKVTSEDWKIDLTLDIVPGATMQAEAVNTNDVAIITIVDRVLDFVIDSQTGTVGSRSDDANNPAVLVETIWRGGTITNRQWYFARHPGFDMHANDPNRPPLAFRYLMTITTPPQPRVKDYKSTLEILVDDKVIKTKTIEVNDPLSYAGYTFFQSGYNPEDLTWSSLQVGKDPSVGIVYTGFTLLIVGLFILFYMYPLAPPPGRTGATRS